MKRVLLLVVCFLLVASMAFAQTTSIGLFPDAAATDCNLYDTSGLVYVYVFHLWSTCTTGSQFMVEPFGGFAMSYLAETVTSPFLSIGNSQTGIAIAYPTQQTTMPLMILTLQYFAQGMSATCSGLRVVPDPNPHPYQDDVIWTDCGTPPAEQPASGGWVMVNPDETCTCSIPTEDTSWGQIKSLYQ